MDNNTSVKEANTSVTVAKMAITTEQLAARSKPRSLWNYQKKIATKSWPMRRAVISTFV